MGDFSQVWFCEACQVEGTVTADTHLDVQAMVHLLLDDHATRSPECRAGTRCLRIRLIGTPDAEWQALKRSSQRRMA